MKNIYARSSTFFFRISIVSFIVLPIVTYLTYIDFFSNFEPLIFVGVSALFSSGTGFYLKQISEKLPEFTSINPGTAFLMNGFNFQQDVSWYSRLYLVSHEGEQLFVIEPTTKKPIARFLTVSSVISSGLIIPITYDVMTLNRSRLFSFTVKNEWKKFRVTIMDEQDNTIGVYLQPWLKSAMKNKGTLFYPNHDVWRQIEAKNMTGDIDIRDEESRITASYRFGMFPYALHPAFQAIPNNVHIKLGPHISTNERKVYLGIFYFWLQGYR
ncbi:hypothetical protein [Paenisporosarcina sp. TG20]|uniref:hypothetical protein n=1 Tax=Paenisporosarcina sp. TG20 TaxID=1211706 RepID=UPI0002DCF9ED|nr:hypothetical protein [Paenisporosarcina sp. TG20]